MSHVALLGTGLLGSGMVETLLRTGNTVTAWNRSPGKLDPLVARGARAAASPADAVRGAARVHLVLAEDDAVEAVLREALPAIAPGTPILDHSTNQPDRVAERAARLRAAGHAYVHAPVFMSPANAREGSGVMLFAGPKGEFDTLSPALAAMTGRLWFCGERPDLAAVHKLSGNAVLIGLAGLMGDVLALGAAQGLSADEVLSLFEVFQPGAALPRITKRVADAGTTPTSFALAMARKDVRLMLTSAGSTPLVVLPAVAAAMDRALAEGKADEDYAIYARNGG